MSRDTLGLAEGGAPEGLAAPASAHPDRRPRLRLPCWSPRRDAHLQVAGDQRLRPRRRTRRGRCAGMIVVQADLDQEERRAFARAGLAGWPASTTASASRRGTVPRRRLRGAQLRRGACPRQRSREPGRFEADVVGERPGPRLSCTRRADLEVHARGRQLRDDRRRPRRPARRTPGHRAQGSLCCGHGHARHVGHVRLASLPCTTIFTAPERSAGGRLLADDRARCLRSRRRMPRRRQSPAACSVARRPRGTAL